MANLGDMAEPGPTHHLIGHPVDNDPIGAYAWTPLSELDFPPSQQSLWAARATAQTCILTEPTHGATAEFGASYTRRELIAQRSQWHISRNLRWTSQALAVAHTRKVVHGGSSWTTLNHPDADVAQCIALFANSIFGAVLRWTYAQTTQPGRARLQIKSLPGHPCPDFAADTDAARLARDIASLHFDELAGLVLQPFGYCSQDPNRHRIDNVVAAMLGLTSQLDAQFDPPVDIRDMLARWRWLFCREPAVHGHNREIRAALDAHAASGNAP